MEKNNNTAASSIPSNENETEGKMIGYVRVSTREQNEDRQVIAMREFGVPEDCILVEKQSGKDFNRPIYQSIVAALRPGDVLLVASFLLSKQYMDIIPEKSSADKSVPVDT